MSRGEISAKIDAFARWVRANGGEVVAQSAGALRYRSMAGDGSVTLGGRDPVYTGDARLAWVCCQIGTTLSPFALRPVEPPHVVQSLRARANHTVTIIADASLCPDTGAAGWAAWMIADGMGSDTAGAPIIGPVADSGEAELLALDGALNAAELRGYVVRGAEVLLQSDSLWALSAIRYALPSARDRKHATAGSAVGPLRKGAMSMRSRIATESIAVRVDALSLTLAVRHVPGHTAGDGRQWVNRQCDRLAKKHMRAARAALALTPPHRSPDHERTSP